MQNLLYYPGFEIQDENWLKFALLYIDKLRPIIPEDADKHISKYSQKIYDHSDLLEKYRPEYQAAYRASLDAIDTIEKILTHPDRYSPVFRTSQIDSEWKNTKKYFTTIYSAKYTYELEQFLIDKKLAVKNNDGLKMSQELALLYMTIFAQAISDYNEISPITDLEQMDRFSVFVRHKNATNQPSLTISKKIIELKLPDKISTISLDNIFNLRKQKDFKLKLKAFNKAIDDFVASDNQDKSTENFLKSNKHIYNEFNNELMQLGFGLTSFGIGIWLSTLAPVSPNLEIAQKFLEGGVLALSGIAIASSWKNVQTKRYYNKYLADLSGLT